MNNIQETATQLADKYKHIYEEWCRANPGKIMNGTAMMEDTLRKAAFCETLEEIRAMWTYYNVCTKWAENKNTTHGFRFSREAISELIRALEEEN